MPVRSLSSRVLVWPNRARVEQSFRAWVRDQAGRHPEIERAGYFGSYARGTWGVGSDLDIVLIVGSSDEPWERRAASWDTRSLPLSVDIVVYTSAEWSALLSRRGTLPATVSVDVIWVFEAGS